MPSDRMHTAWYLNCSKAIMHTPAVPELLLLPMLSSELAVQGNNAFTVLQGPLNLPVPFCLGPVHTQDRHQIPHKLYLQASWTVGSRIFS